VELDSPSLLVLLAEEDERRDRPCGEYGYFSCWGVDSARVMKAGTDPAFMVGLLVPLAYATPPDELWRPGIHRLDRRSPQLCCALRYMTEEAWQAIRVIFTRGYAAYVLARLNGGSRSSVRNRVSWKASPGDPFRKLSFPTMVPLPRVSASLEGSMPCIRCGKITVKLCACSLDAAKNAFSDWSEVDVQRAIGVLQEVLELKRRGT
jgi:hypothetical protein